MRRHSKYLLSNESINYGCRNTYERLEYCVYFCVVSRNNSYEHTMFKYRTSNVSLKLKSLFWKNNWKHKYNDFSALKDLSMQWFLINYKYKIAIKVFTWWICMDGSTADVQNGSFSLGQIPYAVLQVLSSITISTTLLK